MDELKSYSATKLDDVKNYGTNQFNRIAEVARLNAVLNVADAVVDKFLPAAESEAKAPAPESDPPTEVGRSLLSLHKVLHCSEL